MKTYKDIALLFLASGISAVEESFKAEEASPDVFVKACDHLRDSHAQQDIGPFEAFIVANIEIEEGPGRGRPGPEVGNSRVYKAQRVGENEPFIRLPVHLLGCRKGSPVKVTFQDGKMLVEAVNQPAESETAV